jgi:uncharacterized membrane protein YfhO
VSFLAYEPHHILIEIDAPADGMLILNDTYYPGWTATVNSVDTAIVRANGVWRGVAVPAGNSVVEMRYRSRYLTLGSVISGLSLLVGVAGLFLERNKIVLP